MDDETTLELSRQTEVLDSFTRAMRNHPRSIALQIDALGMLHLLTRFEKRSLALADRLSDVVEAVVQAMDSDADSLQLQQRGCSVLLGMARDKATQTELLLLPGVFGAISRVICVHAADTEIQLWACGVLMHLAMPLQNRKPLARMGVTDLLLRAMADHLSSEFLQQMCCQTLAFIAHYVLSDRALCSAIAQALVRAMSNHPHSGYTQYLACAVLRELARSEDNGLMLIEHEFSQLIDMALMIHGADLDVFARAGN
jgi:hypothetical protein